MLSVTTSPVWSRMRIIVQGSGGRGRDVETYLCTVSVQTPPCFTWSFLFSDLCVCLSRIGTDAYSYSKENN